MSSTQNEDYFSKSSKMHLNDKTFLSLCQLIPLKLVFTKLKTNFVKTVCRIKDTILLCYSTNVQHQPKEPYSLLLKDAMQSVTVPSRAERQRTHFEYKYMLNKTHHITLQKKMTRKHRQTKPNDYRSSIP